jgi:prephenate dehydrogenase
VFQRIAIAGVGLIGGSFALAMRKAGFSGTIAGVSSTRTLDEAESLGVIDARCTLEQAAAEYDLVYLAQPISGILRSIEAIGKFLRPDSLVTDAGSTKAVIADSARKWLRSCKFIGGHPMAGKESRGVASADADLFRGRTYVLTGADLESPLTVEFVSWIERIGAIPVFLDAEEHDRTVALTSHVPQLLSTALGAMLAERELSDGQWKVAGPGLTDMTRLAMSSYEIWRDILETNHEPIESALTFYIDKLIGFRENLTSQQLRVEFESSADVARRLRTRV